MRHGKKVNHLSRKSAHRKAMLANMASSLIEHKRIKTTVAKAKALRVYVEPVLTKSKNDTTHSRRTAFRYLRSKEAVKILFDEVAHKIANRPGGYLRIISLGNRLGDNAELALVELVDYNDVYTTEKTTRKKKKRTRRGGSGSGSSSKETSAPKQKAEKPSEKKETAAAKEVKTETPEEEKSVDKEAKKEASKEVKSEEPKEEAKQEKKETAPKTENKEESKKEEQKEEDKEDDSKEK